VLHAIVPEDGGLLLICDEDDVIYLNPEDLPDATPIFPVERGTNGIFYEVGEGLLLAPGTWRRATDAEIEDAGWTEYFRVRLVVTIVGPPSLLAGGAITIGATAPQGTLGTSSIPAFLALKREVGGKAIETLVLRPKPPLRRFGDLRIEHEVDGRAVPADRSEELSFQGGR
jgi:hypothetical protein